MRRLFSRNGIRKAIGLGLMLLACAQAANFLPTLAVEKIENFIYDMRMKVQPAVMDPRIVIINIDEKSLAEFGWPWSRSVMATLVTSLSDKYHAKAIGFDVLFAEPDTSSGYRTLEALADKELKDIPAFRQRLQALKPMLDFDGRFADALRQRPVILGYFFSDEKNSISKGALPPPMFTVADLNGKRLDALQWHSYNANLPELQAAATAGGAFNPYVDRDGVIRQIPLLSRFGDGYYESLALATARVALGATAVRPSQINANGDAEVIQINTWPKPKSIPVGVGIKMIIPYHGKGGPDGGNFHYVSAADVLAGSANPAELDGKIMLVGTTVPSLKDLRTAPVGIDFPGVEMNANVITSILDGKFKQQPDTAYAFEVVQDILIGLLLIFMLPVLTPTLAILLTMISTAALIGFNFWMYQSFDLVLPIATSLLLVIELFIFNMVWGFLFEHRRSRAMANLFGEYVAPELVAEMAENPETYSMESESRVLTVLFVDVRGFTTISESLDEKALREYINIYLTAMSEDIRGNRGTLDKYIGDAVMAFWGAPVDLPDHATRAVASALKMQQTAHQLNEDFIARGWPQLKIGIGLNTGKMRVGDMGSKIRRAYTVMGDAVNLSSRLEGITKVYGAGVVVGEATMRAAPEFVYRELDRVRVKGKNEPVPIFEPLGRESELSDAQREALGQWHAALERVRAQQWDQAERIVNTLHQAYPQDGLYQLYLQRLAVYREHPPGDDWDGVTVFDSK